MRLPKFPPFAQAQAAGLVLGLIVWLWALFQHDYSLRIFLIVTAGAWVAWEYFLGRRAPSHSATPRALIYGFASGFAFPGVGFALSALAAFLRP
ncbi:MAG: hypothetical protein R3C16_10515 [Hyphomonadaceae bacterium]